MKKKIKKIAFLIPSLHGGGMERVMSEIIKYVSANHENIECHLVLYGKNRKIFYEVPDSVIVYRPSFVFEDNKRHWMTIKTMKFIRSTVKSINPDTILNFGEVWNNLVLLSLYGIKTPIYVSDRNSPDASLGRLHDKLRTVLYPKATGIIAQTSQAADFYKKTINHKNVRVIGNPIRAIKNDRDIVREKIVVSVGRLISSKNFDHLIDIFSRIDTKDWKLIIVGGDVSSQNNNRVLQNQINKLGQNDRIIMAGSQKDVESYLLKSSIFAFTSSSEGFPNVIGEAMSAGLPVVAYDCVAGPSDMIDDGNNGFLIPLYDDNMFEEKLRYLMNNIDIAKQMGSEAERSIKRFSVKSIGEQFYEFITNEKETLTN